MRWNDLVDAAVELPIAPSFTRLGHDVRSRTDHWQPVGTDMAGRVVVVTGATSGLGRSATTTLAELGATVVLVGRDAVRTEAACAEIRGRTGNDRPRVRGRRHGRPACGRGVGDRAGPTP